MGDLPGFQPAQQIVQIPGHGGKGPRFDLRFFPFKAYNDTNNNFFLVNIHTSSMSNESVHCPSLPVFHSTGRKVSLEWTIFLSLITVIMPGGVNMGLCNKAIPYSFLSRVEPPSRLT
jgi:hypothetical protein